MTKSELEEKKQRMSELETQASTVCFVATCAACTVSVLCCDDGVDTTQALQLWCSKVNQGRTVEKIRGRTRTIARAGVQIAADGGGGQAGGFELSYGGEGGADNQFRMHAGLHIELNQGLGFQV